MYFSFGQRPLLILKKKERLEEGLDSKSSCSELSIHAVSTHELLKPKDEPTYSLAPNNMCTVTLSHPGMFYIHIFLYRFGCWRLGGLKVTG
ncbi:unnamed protein product [Euphydryas editha]|uniref:Uncharacterized protein n=1 Tax=Euphydryas editha TaxID=104508 RepID=A0AAU9V1E0_EUPED|nr:unnamed protein product [Euphydryas editha]